MTEEELIEIETMILASGIISQYNGFSTLYGAFSMMSQSNDKAIIEIINYSEEIVRKRRNDKVLDNKEVNDNNNNKETVYNGDLVILSIDKGEPQRYFIHNHPVYQVTNKYLARFLSVFSDLGKGLLNKSVGDVVEYPDSEQKKQHSAKILSIRKTELSVKYNDYELEVDKKWGDNKYVR